ncbi:hypothetical protein QL285_075069 [Trifolium repens]|nr:hypothetical protein QL285_075069 [Trifolium repens]
MSQYSRGSQYTPEQKFLHKSEILPLSKIILLPMDTQVVTVIDTICIKASKNDWYFQGCLHCPKVASGPAPPYTCIEGHSTEMQLWKYRLDVDVCYNNTESVFTFWDRECTQILGISAADLRDKMIAVGITDPTIYPVEIETIEGKTLAVKIKWQYKWKNASVNQVHVGEQFIADIKSRFPSFQEVTPIPKIQKHILEAISTSQSVEQSDDLVLPTVPLSDEIDPSQVSMITPSKRNGSSVNSSNQNEEVKDLIGSKMSSTKMTRSKHAKKE